MAMDTAYYFDQLYPLQDKALQIINNIDTGLYLTGGTATSRAYLHHRFSDDLDLFANHDERFSSWGRQITTALAQSPEWHLEVSQTEERFVRLFLHQPEVILKIEMVNDVPAHVGEVRSHPVLGRLDSPENILANKVSAALDRQAPKDFADIWGFCTQMNLSLTQAITDAQSKAAGIFPPDLARVLLSTSIEDWKLIRWHNGPDAERFVSDLHLLGERLLLVA